MTRPTLDESVVLHDDAVAILDRRRFPFERVWVRCATVDEVAVAITDMVTQSSGPYFAALYGMVLAARDAAHLSAVDARAALDKAGDLLVASRSTNNHLRKAVNAVLAEVDATGQVTGNELVDAATRGAANGDETYRAKSRALGEHSAKLLPDGARVLTHCWADAYLIETVAAAGRLGKDISFVCTETRPYLQGARLTAETLAEMGVDTTLITDGMGASVLQSGAVDVLLTAADRVTLDGHVVNKIGTLGLAVAAHAFGVPFLAQVQAPDPAAPTAADVPIEYRDGAEVLHTLGVRTASDKVRGHYPAFDVTPPRFVTTIVTDRGPFAPDAVARYHQPA
ncbi:s-methyl-5-thioribose-1-phosphate isomerase [Actinokineospora globicatena]|uniref:s-methyl-5-thioribose-1-phosphate isomerase n=1 Tax=Actinokineospora globicatena TaxID=103729 RepID=UPI0020A43666|nr:s-methyl-5-thioribose-1-phosphate isomerase [Actinokineospora globicatena]MCP2306376.1 methylthioribose-1-phosphate isomerase [Actinokineospora globicatena]GLW81803.1 methylthioribose-1-phosphate isomerase [Actinokineospora globicatena]GLW88597.1 methylthioribose-1-phosphate isomerase [Actinokineospora globicatena]